MILCITKIDVNFLDMRHSVNDMRSRMVSCEWRHFVLLSMIVAILSPNGFESSLKSRVSKTSCQRTDLSSNWLSAKLFVSEQSHM